MDIYKIVGKLVLEGKDQFNKDVEDTRKNGINLASSIGKGLAAAAKVGAAAIGVAATTIAAITKASVASFSEYEQLAGGMQKIFADMDTTQIVQDASEAYRTLGMTANEYLAIVNDAGASFAATMGAKEGYEAAKKGLTAISDYASGTGKNFNELQQKLAMITRSTSSYQSIADQFSGILPATSAGFLEQAQAAGFLSTKYKQLTDVPIEEYQKSVTEMLAYGVEALNLTGNTAAEASETIQGSLTMTKAAWENLKTGLANDDADIESLIDNLITGVTAAAKNLAPKITEILSGMSTFVTQMTPILSSAIPVIITQVVPSMLMAGVQLLQSLLDGISQNVDSVASSAVEVCTMLITVLSENLDQIVEVGMQLIVALITGVAEQLPELYPVIVTGLAQAVVALIEAVPDFLSAGVQYITSLGEGISNTFSELFPQVGPWVEQNIYQPIKDMFGTAVSIGGEIISNLWQGLCEFANTLFPGLGDLISGHTDEAASAATASFDDVPDAAKAKAEEAAKAMASAAKVPVDAETPVSAMATVMDNDTSMETAGVAAVERAGSSMDTAAESGFKSAGISAMQQFINGLNAMESAVMRTVDAIAAKAVQRIKDALKDVQFTADNAGPELAVGLDYVPYDEFPAVLHKGEAVLTAAEAAVWRAGKRSGEEPVVMQESKQTSSQSGITIVQNIQTVPQTPVEFAAATEAYFEQARWSMA